MLVSFAAWLPWLEGTKFLGTVLGVPGRGTSGEKQGAWSVETKRNLEGKPMSKSAGQVGGFAWDGDIVSQINCNYPEILQISGEIF